MTSHALTAPFSHRQDPGPLLRLRRQWALFAALGALFLFSGALFLAPRFWPATPQAPLLWFLTAAAALIWQMFYLWHHLAENHREGEEAILPVLGAGNALTLFRGFGFAAVAGFVLSPKPEGLWLWVPAAIYLLAVCADYADGWMARKTDHCTALGKKLDMELDSLGMAVATALAVQYGQLPLWYLTLAAAPYLWRVLVWMREHHSGRAVELPESNARRLLAGTQMGFIATVLFPLFQPPVTTAAAVAFGLPYGLMFVRDGFLMFGKIAPDSPLHPSAPRPPRFVPAAGFVARWATVVLGALTLEALFGPALRGDLSMGIFAGRGVALAWLLGGVGGLAVLLIAAGWLERTSAFLLLLIVSAFSLSRNVGAAEIALIASAIAVMHFGSGPLSFVSPEDRFLSGRAGLEEEEARRAEEEFLRHSGLRT
ncbi:MAG: CDP-alcohol phosphatidyltransferase family protein [Sumerlaeia bacterium]